MHSSGGNLVWVVPAWSQGGFTCMVWGCTWSGGVYLAGPGGCTCLVLGAYLPGPGGTCLVQGYLPGPGGCTWSGGGGTCLVLERVYLVLGSVHGRGVYLVPGGYLPRHSPPCEQNSWHTLLKILPCPKLRLPAVTRIPVGWVPSAAVARVSCSGGCLSGGGLSARGNVSLGCTPPPPMWTDRHLWKHNSSCGR